MRKVFLVVAVLYLVASPAEAVETDGRLGLGADYAKHITVTYGLSRGRVVGGGLGLVSTEQADGGTDLHLNLGGFYQHPVARGDRAGLYLDFGLEFASIDGFDGGAGTLPVAEAGVPDHRTTTIWTPHVGLTVRVWMGRDFSLTATHGLALDLIHPPGGADSRTNFRTFSGDLTEVSFSYWLDAR